MARPAVITIAHGRHGHLMNQRRGLANSFRPADLHIVVAMGDPQIRTLLADAPDVIVVDLDVQGALPLAQARNLGAAAAMARGADPLIFLDVDCIPSTTLIGRYVEAITTCGQDDALYCGTVNYLPPPGPTGYPDDLTQLATPHPSRPAPPAGAIQSSSRYELFWSLSFAVQASTWARLGGFCEDYRGYGGEDTDFAFTARASDVGLRWVGGATAYHQYHPVSDPPAEHLDDILINAKIFYDRWRTWPMTGWLEAFRTAGLATYCSRADRWERVVTYR